MCWHVPLAERLFKPLPLSNNDATATKSTFARKAHQMTAVYDKLGLKFLYPENWKLIEDSEIGTLPTSDDVGTPKIITLETPDGSTTWSVHVYGSAVEGDAVLKETLLSLQEMYEDLEVAPFVQPLGELEGTGVEAMFYCLDFLIRSQLYHVKTEKHLLLFWAQAEDRAFETQQIVFQALAISLLQSLNSPGN